MVIRRFFFVERRSENKSLKSIRLLFIELTKQEKKYELLSSSFYSHGTKNKRNQEQFFNHHPFVSSVHRFVDYLMAVDFFVFALCGCSYRGVQTICLLSFDKNNKIYYSPLFFSLSEKQSY